MPLPHPAGYRPRPQGRVDRRRILLAGVLFSFFAVGAACVFACLCSRLFFIGLFCSSCLQFFETQRYIVFF